MSAKPKSILVMRHAEKPADPSDPNLSPQGYARAQRLATYIPQTFGRPDYIFAAANSKHSARPYQTVEPLSQALEMSINDTFADDDYASLSEALLSSPEYAGKQIVVCWHHEHIPLLMAAIGCMPEDYPDPWDPEVFNLILNVQFVGDTPTVTKVVEPF